jgi:hypothetical protein
MTHNPNPYVALPSWRLRRAYRRLFKDVQRLIMEHHGILAGELRSEMSRIVAELDSRTRS